MGFDMSPRGIILFVVSVAFLVAVIPDAINDTFNVDTSGWDPAVAGLWVLVGLGIVATIVLHFVPSKGGKGAS